MIKVTLQNTTLPIRATLHPSEDYSEQEISALDALQSAEERFRIVELPMHDALASCSFVVTENSSAAFHAILYEKSSVLFASIDFHHVCFQFDPECPVRAFEQVLQEAPDFRAYLYWYWHKNCIEIDGTSASKDIVRRMSHLGWSVPDSGTGEF